MIHYSNKKQRTKYGNTKVKCGGMSFDSKTEHKMYVILCNMKHVKCVNLHTRHDLVVNEYKVCSIIPDFEIHTHAGDIVYADAKSDPTETNISSLKFKLFYALFRKKIYIIPKQIHELVDVLGINPDKTNNSII